MPGVPCRIGVLPLGWPPRLPWHWAQDAVEDSLARRLERVQDRIGIGQRAGAGRRSRRRAACTLGEENCALWKAARSSRKLAGGSTVIAAWSAKRAERLVLQRVDAAVELVAAALVRPARRTPAPAPSGPVMLDVEDRGNGAPDVGDGLAGRAGRCRARDRRPAIEQLDVRGQRDRDANQAVLRQVREVVRGRAVDAEVVGVDRAEQRIVDAGRGHLREPRLRRRRGQLEVLGIHVAVGTRAAVAAQAGEGPVVEVRLAATERRVDRRGRRRGAAVGVERRRSSSPPQAESAMRAEQHERRSPEASAWWIGFMSSLRDPAT